MPVVVEIADPSATQESFNTVFDYFTSVDGKFSTYKNESEISRINRDELSPSEYSEDMKTIFALSEETKRLTDGYFDIRTPNGLCDPSGIVKGWAIQNTAKILKKYGCRNFYIEAGGDIQTNGTNAKKEEWGIGIRNPFNRKEIVKVIYPHGHGVATSGTYIRGKHIYNPHTKQAVDSDVVSLTVIGPNIYEADRFATSTFAMGRRGIEFVEQLEEFEGYSIDGKGTATMTSGFETYTTHD